MRRIGLFGGSFDPVHLGHLALARAALDGVALDQLLWIPAGRPWQKARAPTEARHRLAMLECAIAGEPRFRVDEVEIRRPGPSYTLDTVRELQGGAAMMARPEWFLLIGQDQYARFSTWNGWRELLQRVTLAVAARDGQPARPDPALAGVDHRCLEIDMPAVAVSSTAVRERLAQGLGVDGMVPPGVAAYIEANRLYRPAASAN